MLNHEALQEIERRASNLELEALKKVMNEFSGCDTKISANTLVLTRLFARQCAMLEELVAQGAEQLRAIKHIQQSM